MLYRWCEKLGLAPNNIDDASWKAFMNLAYGVTASSPQQALELAMITPADDYLMNRDRLLAHVLHMLEAQDQAVHRQRPDLSMPGTPVYQAMGEWLDKARAKGAILPHDAIVGRAIAGIVSGGDIKPGSLWSEQDLYDAERRAFIALVKTPETQARIDSMLDLGQNLRN
jgi:3-hydroxyacyl-CoA dehydrogenase